MHSRYRNFLVVLCLTLLGLLIPAYFLLFDQSQSGRDERFNRTLGELQRGNYFAWAQLRLWLDRLTPKEERSFDLMCLQYSSTNHVFHVRGIVWPPEPTPTRFRAWSAWLKGGVGMEDRTLAYDVIEFPPHHDLRLNIPERMFNLPPPDPPAKVPGARAVPVIQPPAVPAR